MSKERRQYTDAFKRDAVAKLTSERGSISRVAKEAGVDPSLVHNWRKKFGAVPTDIPQATHSDPASLLAPSKNGPLQDAAISRSDDQLLEAVWSHAQNLPMRERFSLVAEASQRLL